MFRLPIRFPDVPRVRRHRPGSATPRWLAAAFAAALVLGGCIVLSLVGELDRQAGADSRTMVTGALERELDAQKRSTANTSHWNEAVQKLYGGFDEAWAVSNITKPTHTYVIDDRGRTLFVHRADGRAARPLAQAAPAAASALLAELPHVAGEDSGKRGSGIVALFDGRPAIITAAAIMPETKAVAAPRGRLRYLLYVEQLDEEVLGRWSASFGLDRLSWLGADREGRDHFAVTVVGGPRERLSWRAPQPGWRALTRLRLPIAAALLLFAAMSAWIIRLVIRAEREIAGGLAAATAHADSADEAKRTAEAALARSRGDQQRLVDMIKHQVADEKRHRAEIEASARHMADAIERAVSDLVGRLLTASRDLEGSATGSLRLIEIQQVQARAVQQRSGEAATSVLSIATAINQLGGMLKEVGTDTQVSRRLIAEAAVESAGMRDASLALCARVDAITRAAEQIAAVTRRTGTLALNATIEAARAGEAGRGFTVVAGEVKSLAAQTAQLNTEVQASIAEISSAVRSGADLAGHMHGTLEQLAASAISTLSAIDGQREATRELSRTSGDIEDYAQVALAGTDAFAASLHTISEKVCSTRAVGSTVREAAESLRAELDRFVGQLRGAAPPL